MDIPERVVAPTACSSISASMLRREVSAQKVQLWIKKREWSRVDTSSDLDKATLLI